VGAPPVDGYHAGPSGTLEISRVAATCSSGSRRLRLARPGEKIMGLTKLIGDQLAPFIADLPIRGVTRKEDQIWPQPVLAAHLLQVNAEATQIAVEFR
jgi:hypothetical protein